VVFQARARSERDVKGFLKTGLAAEHHRVGQLLGEIFQEMLQLDSSTTSACLLYPRLALVSTARCLLFGGRPPGLAC